jgi:spore photoproduct lyase
MEATQHGRMSTEFAMNTPHPNIVRMEAAVASSFVAEQLRKNLPDAVFEVVEKIPDGSPLDPHLLEVVSYRGRFVRECPGTRHYLCCGYRILHIGMQCSLDCTYCILQAYFNQPNLRLFGNTDEMLYLLDLELKSHPNLLHRFGTGEFTDSLLLDPWTNLTSRLVPFFSGRSNAILELKTKTDSVGQLLDLDHGGNTIVAWSLNAPSVCRHEEARAASLHERLRAARRCAEKGYSLAFHFDPLIEHTDWRRGYGDVLNRLFDAVDPQRIVWISLGAFRYMPELKAMIRARHPRSKIIYGEFVRGLDGKMRYFREIRVELFSFMLERIRKVDPDLCVYLCMESEDIWRDVFGFSPEERGGLPMMLDNAVGERMGMRSPSE